MYCGWCSWPCGVRRALLDLGQDLFGGTALVQTAEGMIIVILVVGPSWVDSDPTTCKDFSVSVVGDPYHNANMMRRTVHDATRWKTDNTGSYQWLEA